MDFLFSLSPTYLLIAALWLTSAIFDHSGYTYYLQLKEYRFDRFMDFLRTREGNRVLLQPDALWRALGALAAYAILHDTPQEFLIILGILLLDAGYIVYRILVKKKIRYPKPTAKATLIVLCAILLEAYILLLVRDVSTILLILVFRFFLIVVLVIIFNIITTIIKKQYIFRATKKLAAQKQLTVVAITGSYGKSSVKEFLAHLLEEKFTVVKTPNNINTEIGIARFILSHDFSKDDIFVCEMGAYTIGEIKLMCDMVHPSIGILTAISTQHLALFGSIRNIQKAKYELLEAIPEDGLVVTNADNPYCIEMLDTLRANHIMTFGTDPDKRPDCLITNIKASLQGTSYEGICMGEPGKIETPVIGAHHAYNIAPAVLVAVGLGVEKQDIIERAKTFPTNQHGSLQVYPYGKSIIIDDSYNSNPNGFRAALDVCAKYPSEKHRIVITRGMLELADQSKELHEQIGGEIAFVADELVVITEDYYDEIKTGVGSKYQTDVQLITDHKKLLAFIQDKKNMECVILLENRMPEIITQELAPFRK